MADHLVDGPPNAKRQKLEPFPGASDSAFNNNYGVGPSQALSNMGDGIANQRNQWTHISQPQNVFSNMDAFDLENDLPDELMSSPSWDNIANSKPPAQGPGPGAMQNGIDGNDGAIRPMNHILGNKTLVANALSMAGGQLGSKSPLQSPPNVSVTKGGNVAVDQMNLGSLPSSLSNSIQQQQQQQSMANNGSSPQVMSSMQGAGGNMIMTNSNMNTIGGGMAGGGLVVSSSVNKPPNMLAVGNPAMHPNHQVVVPPGMQNGPIVGINRVPHMGQRAPGPPHNVHMGPGGPRLGVNPIMLSGGPGNPGMQQGNTPYTYPNPNGAGPQVGGAVVTPQQKLAMAPGGPGAGCPRFGGPSGGGVNVLGGGVVAGGVGGGEVGLQTQPPAPSPAQPQSGAPSGAQPGPQQATQNQGQQGPPPPPAPSTDPEKRKLIQQQLVLLLHAHKCQRRESNQANGEVWLCTLPHCKTMKNVLNHMTTCNAGKSCSVAHCSSSRQIITHWKNCTRGDCPVCLPLKQADKSRNNPNAAVPPPQTPQPTAQQQSATDMRRAYEALGIQCPTTGAGPTPAGLIPNPGQPRNIRMSMVGNPQVAGLGTPLGVRVLAPPNQQNVSLSLGSDPLVAQGIANQAQSLQQSAMFSLDSTQLPGGLQPGQVTASPVSGTKEWHQSVTPDLRNHLVHKLVQAIFPTPDPQALLDKRMHNLVAYAKKVEGDMYEMANSRSEYYHLLAEKIYKIQKELEEKRQRRKEQQMQQQQNPQIRPGGMQGVQVRPPGSVPPPGGMMGQQPIVQPGMRSTSPSLVNCLTSGGVLNAPGNNRNMIQQQQPGSNLVGLPGPSPTPSNPGLSPFGGNPLSQGSTTSGFQPNSNGPVSLPQASPAGSFHEMMKRISPSPGFQVQTPLGSAGQPQSTSVQTPTSNGPTPRVPNTNSMTGLPATSTSETTPSTPQSSMLMGPKSVSSSRGASPAPQTPVPMPSPANSSASVTPSQSMGKGMSSQERAAQNAPRNSSLNSQMGAILAAAEKEEESPSPQGAGGGKLDQIKTEPMEFKTEPDTDGASGSGGGSGKNIKSEDGIKKEIKSEPMEQGDIKSEIKKEGADSKDGIKVESDIVPIAGDKKQVCIFKPDELRQKLMPTLEKLFRQDPESIPFRQPVDPQGLGIPDYFDIVRKPMDLSSIKRKLDIGQYSDPWEYVDDVWLMFDNAWLYNRKTSRVYRYCTKLSEVFEQEIDPVMQSMGYCCGRKYTFNPQVLCCYGKQLCTIPRDAKYYSYQNRYTFCQKCFHDIPGDTVTLGDDPTQAQTAIKKDQFKEMKNDHLEMEQFVLCTECGRKLHQICVLHHEAIWAQGFTCDGCYSKKGAKRRDNKFNAKRLPVTNLGMYIENRVNIYLKKKEAGAGEVAIRVVSSSEKMVEVKPGMRSKFVETGELHSEFPYRAKALFAFEEVDGTDVCFFGMHVQEYGSECPAPNTRRVYIAYLDSVHFFKPKQFRTAVYHEILLGYMDYVKQLGYTMAHIWACPPSEGDDYIFHCHPNEQKIPKPKRLQDWYKKMLDKGIIERIVLDYKDILKQAMEDNLRSAADLPYFEGDFWPNVLEESIKELDQEEEEKRKQAEAAEAAIFSMTEECEVGPDGKKKGQKKAKKSTKSKANQRKNSKKSNAHETGNDLSAKIFATMEKHKEVFFVIRLHSVQSAASLKPIQDPDPFINCDLMDGRDAFLTLAREKHYEFSSLRRAKFSTMSMLYELHNQGQDKFVYTCNTCKAHVETRYHCTVCDDFDLCIQCYEKEGHPHKMEKLGFDLDDGSSPGESRTNPQEARKLSIQRCIQSLVHACQCRDANCRLPSCQKMKRVVNHTKQCKRKTNGGCPICKQLIALCCYHAKHCQETKCPVPFCSNIKHKLKQQQLQQRLQQAQLLRRRMAVMSRGAAPATVNSMPGGNHMLPPTAVQNVVPGAISPATNMGGVALGMTSPLQAGLKPGTQTPPANVLQVVKQVQEEAARQQAPHVVGYGKVNPGGQGQVQPGMVGQPQIRNIGGHLGAGQGSNLLPMDQWQQRYPGGVGPAGGGGIRPQGPQVMPGQMGQPGAMAPNQGGVVRPGQQVPQGQAPHNAAPQMMQKQALQQLMQTLRSPQSPEQQQQILQILKANPQLMAAFIKQRQQHAQQMQQGGAGAPQQQHLQQIMTQQNPGQQQHQNRIPMPGILNQGQQQQGLQGPPGPQGQPMNPQHHQQWLKHQQFLAIRQQQQQQQQQVQQQQGGFQQPPSYQQQQRLPAIRQPHMGYNNSFQDQPYGGGMQPGLKPGAPGQQVMGPPQGQGMTVQQQQLMQSVRSPPPIRSPQPSPVARPLTSPRNQAVPSPRGPQPSPHDLASSEMLLGGGTNQNHSGGGLHPHASPVPQPQDGGQDVPAMTPQDQLSKFVEQL